LQLCGLLQVPIGGLVPAMIWHVMLPEPGPPTGPPQQSVSLLQRSPTTRQPLATWQMWPPVAVSAHRRLQQLVPPVHACPSTEQLPEPVAFKVWQTPADLPVAIRQELEQQSLFRKQMSFSDAQVAPDPVQRPPWQLPEQHCPLLVQLSPSVVQPPPPVTAAQAPATQVLLQHSPSLAQVSVSDLQMVVPQWPPTQAPLQQPVVVVQAPPAAVQAPMFTAHVFDVMSHWPEQQPLALAQAWPGPPQLTGCPPSRAGAPSGLAPPSTAPPVPFAPSLVIWSPPPSLFAPPAPASVPAVPPDPTGAPSPRASPPALPAAASDLLPPAPPLPVEVWVSELADPPQAGAMAQSRMRTATAECCARIEGCLSGGGVGCGVHGQRFNASVGAAHLRGPAAGDGPRDTWLFSAVEAGNLRREQGHPISA
jgi:hypothetical protein